MWGGLKQRLKDLADDLATPHYEGEGEESDYSDEEDENVATLSGSGEIVTAGLPRRRRGGRQGERGETHTDNALLRSPAHHADFTTPSGGAPPPSHPNRRLQDELDAMHVTPVLASRVNSKGPPAAMQSGGALAHPNAGENTLSSSSASKPFATPSNSSSINNSIPSHTPAFSSPPAHARASPAIGKSGATAAGGVNNSSSSTSRKLDPAGHSPEEQQQARLLSQRVHALEDEKKALQANIQKYQEEVRKNHSETVAYYEQQAQSGEEKLRCAVEENTALQARLGVLESQLASNAAHSSESAARQRLLEKENAELKAVNQALEREKKMLESAASSQQVDKENASRDEELAHLKHECGALTTFTEELQEKFRLLTEGYTKLETTLHQERDMYKDLQRTQEAKLDEYSARTKTAEAQAARLEKQLQEATSRTAADAAAASEGKEKSPAQASLPDAQQQQQQQGSDALLKQIAQLEQHMQQLHVSHNSQLETISASHAASLNNLEEQMRAKELEKLAALEASMQRQVADAQDEVKRMAEQLHNAQAKAGTSSSAVEEAQREKHLLSQKLADLQNQLDAAEKARAADQSRMDSGDASVASLVKVKSELEEKLSHQQVLVQQLQRTVVDCLTRHADTVDLPASVSSIAFSDWIILLTSEFTKVAATLKRAERLQEEWSQTYDQARQVNETLNQQVADAWKTIGELREDISIKEDTITKLQERVRVGDERLADVQVQLNTLTNHMEAEREERRDAVAVSHNANSPSPGAPSTEVSALLAEIEALRVSLQERDDELLMAHRSIDNLQIVLETFKVNKNHDVEAQTIDLKMEIDQLRLELEEGNAQRARHQAAVQEVCDEHAKEMAIKNSEITALHRKLKDLRRALEDTAQQLNGETMIDKRVITHILINFIHAFVAQRRETDDMLKVLSGLLQWDEDCQEKVGLLPGPLNPKPQQQSAKRGLFSWGRQKNSGNAAQESSGGAASQAQGQGSLGSLWVDFLMQESSKAANSNKDGDDAKAVNETSLPSLGLGSTRGEEETKLPPPPSSNEGNTAQQEPAPV